MRTNGIDRSIEVHAASTAHGVAGGVVDLVIVLVKSFHTAEAMQAATSLLGPERRRCRCKTAWA